MSGETTGHEKAANPAASKASLSDCKTTNRSWPPVASDFAKHVTPNEADCAKAVLIRASESPQYDSTAQKNKPWRRAVRHSRKKREIIVPNIARSEILMRVFLRILNMPNSALCLDEPSKNYGFNTQTQQYFSEY